MVSKPSPAVHRTEELVNFLKRFGSAHKFNKWITDMESVLKGNMFAGLHEAGMVVRLPDEARAEFLRLKGAEQFEPMPGRVMREYVVVPGVLLNAPEKLRAWVEKSLAYVSSLPAKAKKSSGGVRGSKSPKK
jgi:TfoX/Sxy family transcriptional regulator of competence genes